MLICGEIMQIKIAKTGFISKKMSKLLLKIAFKIVENANLLRVIVNEN
jgi:hypothetical protein